jgi:MFS family permease
MLMMLVSSFSIGCIPGYNQLGAGAIALLILMRLCQGVAAGGELMGAFIFTVESTESGLRAKSNWGFGKCFWSALIKATGNFGVTIGKPAPILSCGNVA